MPTTTPTSLSVRSARFCPSACLPDGLFYSYPTRRVMRDASSFLSPQAVSAGRARGHVYGHARPPRDDQEGANRDGASR